MLSHVSYQEEERERGMTQKKIYKEPAEGRREENVTDCVVSCVVLLVAVVSNGCEMLKMQSE